MSETTDETRPFVMIPNDILYSKSLTSTEKSLLISLMCFCDKNNNTCSPAIKEISNIMGLCTRTIRKYLKSLEAKGFLKIELQTYEDGGQKSNLYKLNFL